MDENAPTDLQTILSETPYLNLVHSQRERAGIERFIGRYIVEWGYVEFFMAMAISAWSHGDHLQRAMISQPARRKIDRLRDLLPSSWDAGTALIGHLEEGNSYRNALAHSNLAMSGHDGERARSWHLWNVKGRDVRVDIPPEEQANRLARVRVMREAVTVLMMEEVLRAHADLNDVRLSAIITRQPGVWDTWEEWERFVRTAVEMFPVVDAHGRRPMD